MTRNRDYRADRKSPARRVLRMVSLVAVLATPVLVAVRLGAAVLEVSPIDLELDGPGKNVDDVCFWADPVDLAGSLVFVTTKDSGLLEVFSLATGKLVTTIPGFERPNNCAVEGDLLLTTDRDAGEVKVHHLPDFSFVTAFGQDMDAPYGIDVLDGPGDQDLVYVTDSEDSSVHVYDLETGGLVNVFLTGFGDGIEPILADDFHQRIFVARGEDEPARGIGVFDPEGELLFEFGADVFSADAEGLAIYACGPDGYLIAADQRESATEFEVFDRVTLEHLGAFTLRDAGDDFTNSTDGIDILQLPLPGFPDGVLAACDGCGSDDPDEMDVVSWRRIAEVMGLDRCGECVTTPCTKQIVAIADAVVDSAAPDTNFGTAATLALQDHPNRTRETLLRMDVPDLQGLEILDAVLRLTVTSEPPAQGNHGGSLFSTTGDWTESEVTFASRPAPVGGLIDEAGVVTPSSPVDFDVSDVVTGAGTYDFLLLGGSPNDVRYYSREAGLTPPVLLLRVRAGPPPTVTITSPPRGTRIRPGIALTFRGEASDAEGTDLSSSITWRSELDGDLGTGSPVTISTLATGVHLVTAEVLDGAGLHGLAHTDIVVDRAPVLSISSPPDGASFTAGEPVELVATASDPEEGDLTTVIRWVSSLDGLLGSGGNLSTSRLQPGTHTITASATDAAGDVSDRVTIDVVEPPPPEAAPTVILTEPADGALVASATPLAVSATAEDPTDGDLTSQITWTSSLDGVLGTGGNLTVSLSPGSHVVTAAVTNSRGIEGAATAEVTARPVVSPPAAVFDAEADAFVVGFLPRLRFGRDTHLIAEAGTLAVQSFVRFEVRGAEELPLWGATLRLRVDSHPGAGSASGGLVYAIPDTGWAELALTYANRPTIATPVLDSAGAVAPGDLVEFDVTPAISGDGTYVFAIVTTDADAVVYQSRETATGGPQLALSFLGE